MTGAWREYVDLGIKSVGILAAIFGFYKYFADVDINRSLEARQQALSYVDRYGASELRDHRQLLFEFWLKHSDAVSHIAKQGASDDAFRAFFFGALEQEGSPKDLLRALYVISNFFDQVAFCRDSTVCEMTIIDAFFCGNAQIFHETYRPVFDALGRMSGVADFGYGARKLATSCTQ